MGKDPDIFAQSASFQSGAAIDPPTGAILGRSLNTLLCAEGAYIKKLDKRSLIASEGSGQQGLIAVLEGLVKVSTSLRDGRSQILSLRFPGEFISLRTQAEPWFASVEVVEDATLLILGTSKTAKLRRESLQFNLDLGIHTNREIAGAQAHLVKLGRRSPIERLASLLIEFNDRGMGLSGTNERVRIPISRDEIGDYIGLNSETVSRQFTRLKAAGYITLQSPSSVIVRNWEALRLLSNGETSVTAG